MMPIRSMASDQNIGRPDTNMSDHFADQNNANLLPHSAAGDGDAIVISDFFDFNGRKEPNLNVIEVEELGLGGYDHMYASNIVAENGDIVNNLLSCEAAAAAEDLQAANCQQQGAAAESEVKFWKEWLILHLDLIQQQSDEILDKERTILILQQENEMLKERISCMERGAPFQPDKLFNHHHDLNSTIDASSFLDDDDEEEEIEEKVIMTQDAAVCGEEDAKNCLELMALNRRSNSGNDQSGVVKTEDIMGSSTKPVGITVNNFLASPPPLQPLGSRTVLNNLFIDNVANSDPVVISNSQVINNMGVESHEAVATEENKPPLLDNLPCVLRTNGLATYNTNIAEDLPNDVNNESSVLPKTEEDCKNTSNCSSTDASMTSSFGGIQNNSAAMETAAGSGEEDEEKEEFDPMKELRLRILKKRLSNSSAVSLNDSSVGGWVGNERRPFQGFRKRRRRYVRDDNILTSSDQYVTQTGELNAGISPIAASVAPVDIPTVEQITRSGTSSTTTLEVPRWRIKVYGAAYSLEGTENLDDEVYNKRHSRLENDERRRKRWDVQRIREQRVVEKLRQRQERIGCSNKTDDPVESVQSLWPKPEDIRYLELTDHLPVSALGYPIPKIPPSEFSLPWLSNPSLFVPKKVPTKRSTARRRRRNKR